MANDELVYDDTPEAAPVTRSQRSIDAEKVRELRNGPIFKKMKAEFRAACARQRNADGTVGAPCWLDGAIIDYRLQYPHPFSFSLDHAITVKDNPALLMDPANFRASHLDCNLARGTDEPKIDLGEPSELW